MDLRKEYEKKSRLRYPSVFDGLRSYVNAIWYLKKYSWWLEKRIEKLEAEKSKP